MKNLIIIGARGFGREVFSIAKRSLGYNSEFLIKGFLDDNKAALDGFDVYPKILESVENYVIQKDDVFICALGDVFWKKHYIELILEKDGHFINLIDQSVTINDGVFLGTGCIICDGCILSNDVIIDNFVTIHSYSILGHDVEVGDYVHMGAYSFVGGFSSIGEESTIHVKSTILDRKKIGKGGFVGAGSLVIKNVPDFTKVFGNPARKLHL